MHIVDLLLRCADYNKTDLYGRTGEKEPGGLAGRIGSWDYPHVELSEKWILIGLRIT